MDLNNAVDQMNRLVFVLFTITQMIDDGKLMPY